MIKIDINKKLHGANGDMDLKINLNIKNGEFLAIVGESGSGKTTLLRILAGLEEANGFIEVDNNIWLDEKNSLEPQKRDIGFVFQDYALFPNFDVLNNLLYVNKDKDLAHHLLKITKLEELKNRSIQTLSGGQKQRVSLCRALMKKPKLLLLDEPLSALDLEMRLKLQEEIQTLHKKFNLTTIMVSHDLDEIYKLSDRFVKLQNGQIIEDCDTKSQFLNTNEDDFFIQGKVIDIIKSKENYIALINISSQVLKMVINQEDKEKIKRNQMIKIDIKNPKLIY